MGNLCHFVFRFSAACYKAKVDWYDNIVGESEKKDRKGVGEREWGMKAMHVRC